MMRVVAAPRKCGDELRERATRIAVDPRITDQLGMDLETLRNWVRQAEIDGGVRPGTASDDTVRLVELERENSELRRANEILKIFCAFFAAAELDRKIK